MDNACPSRLVFGDKTNVHINSPSQTAHKIGTAKRKAPHDLYQKPLKLSKAEETLSRDAIEVTPSNSVAVMRRINNAQQFTTHRLLRQATSSCRPTPLYLQLSTRPLLRNFVSSNTADVFKIFAHESDIPFALPTCCAYSHAARRGKKANLAVATESGSVEVVDTTRREPWDKGCQRESISINENMIFDIKWRSDDEVLAAASADHTIHVVQANEMKRTLLLEGHVGSPKVVVWDPNHSDLLTSGSRTGEIISWDLRERPSETTDSGDSIKPSLIITDGEKGAESYKNSKSKKLVTRSVTSLLYLPTEPYHIVSSGSTDGILKKWDVRMGSRKRRGLGERRLLEPVETTFGDATLQGSKRARGISSIVLGNGFIYGLGCDSRIHTYPLQLSSPYPHGLHVLADPLLNTNSFYSRLAISPCERWLSVGGTDGSVFLFDIQSDHPSSRQGVRLQGHSKEVGGLDWACGSLASCSDDRTVRVWRPDEEVYASCLADPSGSSWEWTWARDI